MISKKGFFWLIFWVFLPFIVYAKDQSAAVQSCLFLGSKPSLIIKFKNTSSSQNRPLDTSLLQQLTTHNATFSTARETSGNAYVVFFLPSKSMISEQVFPGCYSSSAVNSLIEELKSKVNILYAVPNILLKLAQTKGPYLVPVIGPKQWDMLSPPGGIDAQTAFNTTTGNPNAITAVLDTGVLTNNSLTPNLLSGVTFNNNGAFTTGATPSCDSSCSGYDHGTHVAGTVGASGTFAYGESIYGVAPTSAILPVNVFTKFTNPVNCFPSPAPCLRVWLNDLVNALNWLNGTRFRRLPKSPYAAMVNLSLGATSTSCPINLQK